ncbi:MAG: efflux RND transporter periplasmic adaptor subunit [Anaerolineales bacterium]|jgi:multidrug efflux pump subunit AcrA (membrane-fusion protein)
MKTKSTLILSLLLITGLLISGCQAISGTSQQAESTPLPVVTQEPGVIAEGKLVPLQYVNLSFNTGGKVETLEVAEGDTVKAGQVIAQLDQRQQLAAAVDSAQMELINAQQALKDLQDNAGVATADALQKVADQRDAVRDAERALNNLQAGGKQVDINSAQANVVILKDRLDKAWDDYKPYENKPQDDVKRAQFLARYADAQRNYDNAVRLLNNLQGPATEIDSAIAQANLSLAQASLALAEQDYEKVKDGPDPDLLSSAQAREKAAESGLVAAQAALANRQLLAPFDGTIAQLNLKMGEQATPGVTAAVLADFSGWVVETDDLTENEVPNVQVGQEAEITFDALPELSLPGKVLSISDVHTDRSGDVTYTTKVSMEKSDPRLRWGMTAVVHFSQP